MTEPILHPADCSCPLHALEVKPVTGAAEPYGSDHKHEHGTSCGSGSSAAHFSAAAAGKYGSTLKIQAMDCPTEARLIEKALADMVGVIRLQFDFFERTLTVEHDLDNLDPVIAAIARVGMRASLVGAAGQPALEQKPAVARRWLFALSGLAAIGSEAVAWGLKDSHPLVMVLAMLSILTGGIPTLKKAWIAVRSREMNINFLMALAVTGAVVIGQWPEAAMVLFLFSLAEKLEAMSLGRVGKAVRALMSLTPATAWVADDKGEWQELPVAGVAVGARLRVRPGERVPLDGDIALGTSAFNEAPITGESLPRDKGPGESVFAGSINGESVVEVISTAAANGSVLARIIDSVRDAQASRAPTQRVVDRFARIYTPIVVFVAVALAVLLPAFGVMPLKEAFYNSLVLLVIACPCAMVIATPVTLVSALAAAARSGLLIKGGEALERAAKIRVVAFDKTGTLTTGETAVTEIAPMEGVGQWEVLLLAASLDAHSTHPLARALLMRARELDLEILPTADVREEAGFGVAGRVNDRFLSLGGRRMAERAQALTADVQHTLERFESQGQATLLLMEKQRVLGVVAVADQVRKDAAASIGQLARLGVHSVILSGDNQRVVTSLARVVGLEDARGGLLPQDKLEQISRLQAAFGPIAMVGDGVNDAPALARADLGIAMGAASDTALETASVALMDNRLAKLPQMLSLAQQTMRVLTFNLVFALLVKLVFFALALSGHASLWMAVFADVGASLLVVGNGLRLARALKPHA